MSEFVIWMVVVVVAFYFYLKARRLEAQIEDLKIELAAARRMFQAFATNRKSGETPPPAVAKGWRAVLGFPAGYIPTKDEVTKAYRNKAKIVHPDRVGGSTAQMALLNVAKDAAMKQAR